VLSGAGIAWGHVAWALAGNAMLLALSAFVFAHVMRVAREQGLLLRIEG